MTKEELQLKTNLIETKIKEIKSTLAHWKKEIENYTLALNKLTNQLNLIKKNTKK